MPTLPRPLALRLVLPALLVALVPGGVALAAGTSARVVAAATPGHQRMVAELARVARETAQDNPFFDRDELARLDGQLARLPATASVESRIDLLLAAGLAEFNYGAAERAVARLEAAAELVRGLASKPPADFMGRLHYYLGLAYLRVGEARNCRGRHTPESCILPIRGAGLHLDQGPSSRAVEELSAALGYAVPGSPVRYAVEWLLNIAAMTLGRYPDGVPPEFLVPPTVFASKEPFPRFPDVAPELGLDTHNLAGGAIAEDFDLDGDLDLLTSTWDPLGPLHYFEADGRGGFVERSAEANLAGINGGLNLVQADYDDDGDIDVLVLRGAWMLEAGRHPNSLLRNNADGTFTDVTFEAGLGEVHYPTQTGSWADYDLDGDLDLYVGNEPVGRTASPGQLFRNEGNGTFADVAREAGVENLRYAKAVAWGDYDDDSFPDLFVSNFGGENRLYHNDGDGSFTDVAPSRGVTLPLDSFASWFWDYDNDGSLDLYVGSYPNGAGPTRLYLVVAGYLGLPSPAPTAGLYRGDGRGTFQDVAANVGLDRVLMPMGANFGDLDDDGFLDLYLGTGYPSYDGVMPNVLFHNRRGQRFDDVTFASGTGHLQKGHAVVFADLDADGDQDIFHQLGGFYPEDGFHNALFENPGFGSEWLEVRLVGGRSDGWGVGARIRAEIADGGETRSVYRTVSSGGSFGANPLTQHLGLGAAKRVDRLEIVWPTSGVTQLFRDLPAGRRVEVIEPRGPSAAAAPETSAASGAG